MIEHLYEDLSVHLYEGEPITKKAPTPPPITYLTQWKIVGNSEVHTLPYPDGVVLPNGYKRCEYLQSNGTAYIEVPFGFDKTDEVYIKGAFDETEISTNIKCLVAPKTWNDNTNRFGLCTRTVSSRSNLVFSICYGSGAYAVSPYIDASTDVCEWEYKNYICTIGASSADVSSLIFGGETANLRLFYGYYTPTKCKICEYRHKKANAEYRLIPCLDSNDTPCMYDVINNQAYYNSAGSGSFTYKLYPQPTEIWSCGEYNATDGKYHILVQPLGGSIADIALDEPLRKVKDVADTIEFPSDTEGKALVTRNFTEISLSTQTWRKSNTITTDVYRWFCNPAECYVYSVTDIADILCSGYDVKTANQTNAKQTGISMNGSRLVIYDSDYTNENDHNAFVASLNGKVCIYRLATPTTELIDAPQIAEAESYSCVISQGGKAVEWSSFETND